MQLEQFFDWFVPIARGTAAPCSPAASDEVLRYPKLVAAQHIQAMNAMFCSLERMSRADFPGQYQTWVEAYVRKHPPTHRHPSYVGEHFATFLVSAGAPPWAAEVADVRFAEFLIASAERPCVEIRRYQYDVSQQSRVPKPGPIDVLIYRDPVSLRARTHCLSLAELLTIAEVRGELSDDWVSRSRLARSDIDAGYHTIARLLGESFRDTLSCVGSPK